MVVQHVSAVAVPSAMGTKGKTPRATHGKRCAIRQFDCTSMSALVRSNRTSPRGINITVRAASSVRDLPDDQRVVITGAGVVSTAGNDREVFFDTLCAGTSGAIDLTQWKPGVFDALTTTIGAPIQNLDAGDDLTVKEIRRMDKVHQYAVVAGKRALRDAGLWGEDLDKMDKTRCGVLVGSAMGGMQVYEDNVQNLYNKGIKKVSPFTVPYMLTNMSGAILGMQPELGFRGPNYALNTACATSNYQFINAAQHIKNGQADVILAGGCEAAVTPMGLGGFIACKALSKRNDDPTAAALTAALITPDDVDLVNAHGTSTPVGDLCEVAAVNAVFGGRGKKDFKLNSTKSMLGHQLGASGALEAIACIESIRNNKVHPTINHDDPEDGVDFDVVPNKAQNFEVNVALSNSFGFGGHNSSVVFGAFKE